MKRIGLSVVILFSFFAWQSCAQESNNRKSDSRAAQVIWEEEDSLVFSQLSQSNKTVIEWAQIFLGTTYKSATLESGDDRKVIVNLHAFDCTTFVENVLALAFLDSLIQDDFVEGLTQLRYRNGKAEGYPSRLHYFSEWIVDNEEKNLLKDITQQLGGIRVVEPINFMSKHRAYYPALVKDSTYNDIVEVEKKLKGIERYIIPKAKIGECANRINEGSIIGFATNIKGLDFVHVGFAIKNRDTQELRLLHASSKWKKVVVSEKSLEEYAQDRSDVLGLVVLEVKD